MPTSLRELPVLPPAPEPPRKLWTRRECAALEESGVLQEQHLELIGGELINKMGKKRPHVNAQTRTQRWLVEVFGFDFVNAEAPIDVAPEDNSTNEPEPDLIVLKEDFSHFTSNPRPEHLWLVVEIADTSLAFDLTVKAALYARAGILEYWVVDVTGRRLVVHRHPQGGAYAEVTVYAEQERVSPLGAPEASFCIAEALPREA